MEKILILLMLSSIVLSASLPQVKQKKENDVILAADDAWNRTRYPLRLSPSLQEASQPAVEDTAKPSKFTTVMIHVAYYADFFQRTAMIAIQAEKKIRATLYPQPQEAINVRTVS